MTLSSAIDPLHCIMGMQPIWRTKPKKFSLLGVEIYSHVKKSYCSVLQIGCISTDVSIPVDMPGWCYLCYVRKYFDWKEQQGITQSLVSLSDYFGKSCAREVTPAAFLLKTRLKLLPEAHHLIGQAVFLP